MKQDKFLLGIFIGIVVLVIVALVVFFIRQDQIAYRSDEDPAGVAHNYVLALQQGDYLRAYSYLADVDGKPDAARFQQDFASGKLNTGNAGIELGPASISGDQASLPVTLIHTGRGPFESGTWRDYQTAALTRQGGLWKITAFPYPYWGWDWYATPQPAKPLP